MPADYAWRLRGPESLVNLRVLTLGEGANTLALRFDGREFDDPDQADFLDVHMWSRGEPEWEALYVGALEDFELELLATHFLDAVDGAISPSEMNFIDPMIGIRVTTEGDKYAVRFIVGAPVHTTLAGSPVPVTVLVSREALIEASIWLLDEALRFLSREQLLRSGRIPEDWHDSHALLEANRAWREAQPKTVEEAVAHLRKRFADDLSNPDLPADQRCVVEYLASRLEEDAYGWVGICPTSAST